MVTMMGKMGVLVQAIRIPDRHRSVPNSWLSQAKRVGMSVDQLMLQGHVPGGKPDKQQRGGKQAERLPEVFRWKTSRYR